MIFNLKYHIITVFLFLLSIGCEAQVRFATYCDLGENNVSDGFYLTSSFLGTYQFKQIAVGGGAQFDLKSAGSNFFTGANLIIAKEFLIKDFQFEIQGLLMYNFFSELAHESNWGALAMYNKNHFRIKLGTEFKTYKITQLARENYDIESNFSLHENWNLIYLLQYNLKPNYSKWNIGAAVTNIDHFLINQETNPMFNLLGIYNVSRSSSLFVESWYKSAGTFNISANYFGIFFRTGLIWKPHLRK